MAQARPAWGPPLPCSTPNLQKAKCDADLYNKCNIDAAEKQVFSLFYVPFRQDSFGGMLPEFCSFTVGIFIRLPKEMSNIAAVKSLQI